MSSGEYRRSSRILELDARRSQQAESQNKGKRTCEIALEDLDFEEDNFKLKRGRKRVKIRPVQDLVVNTVGYQVEKVGKSSDEDHHTKAATSSGIVLPEKSKLEMLLGILQRRDLHKIFMEPVNAQEVEGYYEVIREPMDFGTISRKINGGSYKTLEEFEHDIFLVSSNAMLFNHSNTIFYRQARVIRDLAMKLFDGLRSDPVNFGSELFMTRLRAGYRDERRPKYLREDRRATYKPFESVLNENEPIVSSVYKRSEALVQDDTEFGYEQSLLHFVKDLGPTAQMVASRKLNRLSTEASGYQNGTPHHELQIQKHQFSNVASVPKSTVVPSPSNTLRMYSRRNLKNKRDNIPGNNLPEHASEYGTTNVNDVPRSGFTQVHNTMKNSADYNGKLVQTSRGGSISLKQDMVDQGIGNSYLSTSPLGDRNPSLSSVRSTHNKRDEYISSANNKGKNVQIADAITCDLRNPVGPDIRSIQAIAKKDTAFNGSSYFSTSMVGDGKAFSSATSYKKSNNVNVISDAIKKIKNVQVGEIKTSTSMEHHGHFRGKLLQGMIQGGAVFRSIMANQGIGSPDFSTDLLRDFSTQDSTHNDLDKIISSSMSKGKNTQMAEAMLLADKCRKSFQGVREVDDAFKEDMASQDIRSSYFSTPFLGDENSNFPALWNTDNTDGLIASASNKGKDLQVAEMTCSNPMMKVSSLSQDCGAFSSKELPPLPEDITNKGKNLQLAEIDSSDSRMKESIFSRDSGAFSSKELPPFPEAMESNCYQAPPTYGFYSNYLGGGVHQSEAMDGIGGTSHEGELEQTGQAWNWFSPTQMGPQPILHSSFQEQSRTPKVDMAGEARSPKWEGWDSSTPNGQQVMEVPDMNKSPQKVDQLRDFSIGAPLGNSYNKQFPFISNSQQQPLSNDCKRRSALESDFHQQTSLANAYQKQFLVANKYKNLSPLANYYLQQQSTFADSHRKQKSTFVDDCFQQNHQWPITIASSNNLLLPMPISCSNLF